MIGEKTTYTISISVKNYITFMYKTLTLGINQIGADFDFTPVL